MDNQKKINTQKDRESVSRTASETGAENRAKTNPDQSREKEAGSTIDENRAELNGRKGKFETERTRPTGEGTALPGAEEKEVGTASAGAGLGGNKGTGTSSKKTLD